MQSGSGNDGSLFCSVGSETTKVTNDDLRGHLNDFLSTLGDRDDILLLPPDFTRYHSFAGIITQMICEHYNFIPREDAAAAADADAASSTSTSKPKIQILPALGTHAPMTESEIDKMYGKELGSMNRKGNDNEEEASPFVVHDWRNDVVTIGEVPSDMVKKATYGMVDRPWPAQLNKLVWSKRRGGGDGGDGGDKDDDKRSRPLVISIGQVVPHEVMGMANYNKNLFVGTGGVDAINLSHFIGAVHGMEKMMGRKSNPLRDILNHASTEYLESNLDLWYILTVVDNDDTEGGGGGSGSGNKKCIRGLYIGKNIDCYSMACDLSLKVNFTMLDQPIKRCVVYLDPEEFHSTWLGNKAVYRTRMAMSSEPGSELIVLGPGIKRFGEDATIDVLIRKYGYRGTETAMKQMNDNVDLRDNLSVVAHLIHGSSEGRFTVTYCPGHLTEDEVTGVGFRYGNLEQMLERYKINEMRDGWNTDPVDKEPFYYISNPALGLWSVKSRFEERDA